MKKCLALLLTAALLLAALPLALGEEIAYTGTVTGGKLHLRKAPAANGKIINTYNQGTQVEILENDGDWCKVRVGTKEGYMMTQYLSIQANYTHLAWAATPRDGGVLTLFESPEEKGSIVLQCMSGAVFEVTAREGDFSQVRAGDQFAYLPTAALTELSGEFTQGVTAQAEGGLTLAALKNARKEVGAPISRSQSEGNFAYSFSYPELSLQAADEKIAAWLEQTLAVFQADHAAHHPQERGDYTVVYQAVQADERYAGVVLMGEYTAGDTRLQAFLALNLDLDAQRVLAPEELFADLTGPLFMLESEAGAYMTMDSEGYSGRPDAGWLEYAALTDEGLEVYLPAGLFMPLSAGTRRITLKYRQIAGAMALDSAFIQGQARTIDPTRPMIALTFDDGPSEQTAKILDVLAQYDARATFCIQGQNVAAYGDTIKRAIAQGNEIASHTWNHKKLTELSASAVRSQLTRTNDAVRELTGGYEIKVLRPPYGSTNKTVRTICKELGMVIAHWQVDTLDWRTRSTSKTYRAIMKGAKNGAIVLCHDLYSSTAAAIEKAVPELVAQGYQLVTVSELLSFHKDGAQPGTVYAYLDPENIMK